jgi:DNA-binding FadR family transcriptional regulator
MRLCCVGARYGWPAPISRAIAQNLKCARQTVRDVIPDFEQRGLACLERGSNVPVSVEPVLNAEKREL